MKKSILSSVFFLLLFSNAFCQNADDIVGFWLNIDDATKKPDSQIQIFKSGNKYYGKIVWLSEPLENNQPKKDVNNPDKKLRNNPIIGLQLLNSFAYEDNIWSKGTIYDPQSGSTYKCKMWFEDKNKNTLYLRGFIGVSLIGRNTTWKREDKKR
jgi:uncharacterized protein (DUF2147 family)